MPKISSACGRFALNQAATAGSVTNISPASQPSSAAPRVMMIGKRSMIFISSVLPTMISGIDVARPMISERQPVVASGARLGRGRRRR